MAVAIALGVVIPITVAVILLWSGADRSQIERGSTSGEQRHKIPGVHGSSPSVRRPTSVMCTHVSRALVVLTNPALANSAISAGV